MWVTTQLVSRPNVRHEWELRSYLPGETEEQFERTLALVREVGFDRLNTAAYSPRPATPAAAWTGQLADLVKLDRLARLNEVAHDVAEERAQRFMGRDLEVWKIHSQIDDVHCDKLLLLDV